LLPKVPWPWGALLWALGAVEPVGQHEQAKNHEHDDEDVFDFHGESLGWWVEVRDCGKLIMQSWVGVRTAERIKGPMAHKVSASNKISIRYTAE
jgi:hypothetical protein